MVQAESYPTSVAVWSDELLDSVKDFSAVLLALRAGASQAQGATGIAVAPGAPMVPTITPSAGGAATGVAAVSPPLGPGVPGPARTGQPELAADQAHPISGALSNHTGWT